MFGKSVARVVFAAFALVAAAAGEGTGAPVPITPHYSVQNPPNNGDASATPQTAPTSVTPAEPAAAPTIPVAKAKLADPGSERPIPIVAAPKPDEEVRVTALRPSLDSTYRLGAGDKLRVIVFGEDDLSGNFEIDGQGFVRLPLIGQIPAVGMTTYGLEGRIGDALVKGGYLVNPKVNVEVTGYRPFYIIGQVSKPGEYSYVNAMTALNAIALAGGFTDQAVTSTIYVRHQGDHAEHPIDIDETTRILPGDIVRVKRTTYWAIMTILSPLLSPFSAIAYLLK
jgi:hypothetical protein